MKKKSTSQSAPARRSLGEGGFFNLRVLIGLFIVLAGVFLALLGFGTFSAQAQQSNVTITSTDPLVPPGFDCSRIKELGIDKQENMRAQAIMIFCGRAEGGTASPSGTFSQFVQQLLPGPLAYGGADVNLITGTETFPNVTQSETFSMANPDNPLQIGVGYNDSRGRNVSPINISGASFSTDGGTTFTRLTCANNTPPCQVGQSPFSGTVGDPVLLYNKPTGTWYYVLLDTLCGGQGLGGYKSTNPADPNSWTHFCAFNEGSADRESGYADNNPSSPFFGNMYISWNDFNFANADIFVVRSTDNGTTWSAPIHVSSGATFIRDVQITGDKVTGDVYIAGMDENSGQGCLSGCGTTRSNLIYRSTDGGATWTNTYTGPAFVGACRSSGGYFCGMYAGGYWRHMSWGQPAAYNHVVSLVYAQKDGSDPGNVYYIRSTDSGVTFGTPFQLNTNTDVTKAQWQPNLSVSDAATLFAMWYDDGSGGNCTVGGNTPCYQMHARKSNDNGATWLADDTLSDVVSPLPAQPDPGIQPLYVGDYDYGSAILTKHATSWVDGRNAVSGTQQQDAFTDRELVGF